MRYGAVDSIWTLFGRKKRMKLLREKYRALFSTDMGIEVLNDMAINCGYYADLKTNEQMVLSNFFRWVLERIGILDVDHIEDASIIRKLMELPLITEVKDGDRED